MISPIDLYPRSRSPKLDPAQFRAPEPEYRGAPFWCWNTKLDIPRLLRQLEYFQQMGFGGPTIHCRTGLDTDYLGDEFMQAVRASLLRARELGLKTWLYDEDRWPSGFAGGLVTRDPQYRAKHLLFTSRPYTPTEAAAVTNGSYAAAQRTGAGTLLARYDVVLENGCLKSYRRLDDDRPPQGGAKIWHAYLETAVPADWFNYQTYVDTLSRPAIEKFIQVTHERYRQCVGEFFASSVPSIFTDEPQFVHKSEFKSPDDERDLVMPFTTDFFATYFQAYGEKLEDKLPEIFWELPGGRASAARYRYHDHLAERFAAAFADTVGEWCSKNNIAFTGHMMEEPTLLSQTRALGEAMRSYRAFHMPGIDILADWREYTTAKQAQSACHQYARSGVLSELYGVSNWDYSFANHKGQGDWQAALGVTHRVHHLAWVSMAGEAKRDYPASIFYQSPWYKEYPLVETHFARVNVVLTRGQPLVRVGVIHPVESFWLAFGPVSQTQRDRQEMEENFSNLTKWLLFGLIDFDFICESLLPSQTPAQRGSQFQVGSMNYDAVVVPALRTIRSTTLDRLESFAASGGKVIFAGQIPTLVDAQPSDRPLKLAQRCARIEFNQPQILTALDDYRDIAARHSNGLAADALLYQLRQDGASQILFLCNTDRKLGRGPTPISIRGQWDITVLDTPSGNTWPEPASHDNGRTIYTWHIPAHGSVLLKLDPASAQKPSQRIENVIDYKYEEIGRIADPVPITLAEPNSLLLDQAQWRVNDGPWRELEEVLRVENLLRAELKMKPKTGDIAQPWADRSPVPQLCRLSLQFAIQCDVDVAAPKLALEDAAQISVRLDGRPIPSRVDGWFVDEAIQTIALPDLKGGLRLLELTMPFTRKTNVEWCYLLGDFGVAVAGRHSRVIAPVRSLSFGDYVPQGLPFYTGNLIYHCQIPGDARPLRLEFPKFKCPLMSVDLDGKLAAKIAFSPFRADLGRLSPGPHKLDITAYGHRFNAFGCVHNCFDDLIWVGPWAWRATNDHWSYEYQLKPMGILVAPQIKAAQL